MAGDDDRQHDADQAILADTEPVDQPEASRRLGRAPFAVWTRTNLPHQVWLAFVSAGDAPWWMAASPVSASGIARTDQLVLRAAVAAYLGRYRGETRLHTESDLRVFLRWCTDQDLDPLAVVRVDIERYVRWLQDVRC